MVLLLSVFIYLHIIWKSVNSDFCPGHLYQNNKTQTLYCYWVEHNQITFDSAQQTCQGKNGTLAYIPDEETNSFILQTFPETSEFLWIGVFRVSSGFMTTAGEILSYTYWDHNQPGNRETCVAYYFGHWHDFWPDYSVYNYNVPPSALCFTSTKVDTNNVEAIPLIECSLPLPGTKSTMLNNGTHPGDVVLYSCVSGAVQVGGDRRQVCDMNGVWSGLPLDCRELQPCPYPVTTSNTLMTVYGTDPGDIVGYSCAKGTTQISGSLQQTCLFNGSWSGQPLMCDVLVQCNHPIPGTNSAYLVNGTKVGDVALYSCAAMTIQNGGNTERTCQDNGQWSGQPLTCKELQRCPYPVTTSNTLMTVHGTDPGDFVRYICTKGTTEIGGSSQQTCLFNGSWSGQPLMCDVHCNHPVSGTNSTYLVNGTKVGDVALYSCAAMTIQNGGNAERTCQDNGQWSGQPLTCKALQPCPYPVSTSNTEMSVYGTNPGDIVIYSCKEGTTRIGGTTLQTCMFNGSWSEEPLMCDAITSELTEAELNRRLTDIKMNLSVQENQTNAWWRSKNSIYEGRISVKAPGVTAAVILISLALIPVIFDCLNIAKPNNVQPDHNYKHLEE